MRVGSVPLTHSLPAANVTYPETQRCVALVTGMKGEQLLFLLWIIQSCPLLPAFLTQQVLGGKGCF